MRKFFTAILAIGAVLFALNYFGNDESDAEDDSYASDRGLVDARQLYTVIVAGKCGSSGCNAKRSTCKVDVDTGVFSPALHNRTEALLYLGNLGNAPSGECPVGAVIVGVEREGSISDFGFLRR